jgi:hypothetical protein
MMLAPVHRARAGESEATRLRLGVHADLAAEHLSLVGEAANDLVPLRRLREGVAERQALEKQHLERQLAELTAELEGERRARHTAERRVSASEAQVAELETRLAKQSRARLAAEASLEEERRARTGVAEAKRSLEHRFARLLVAYQELVEGFEELRRRYTLVKSLKARTSVDKFKDGLRRFKEIFTNEEAGDPDRPPEFNADRAFQQAMPHITSAGQSAQTGGSTGRCDLCGDAGICRGWKPAPINPGFCRCGHERTMHDFDLPDGDGDAPEQQQGQQQQAQQQQQQQQQGHQQHSARLAGGLSSTAAAGLPAAASHRDRAPTSRANAAPRARAQGS